MSLAQRMMMVQGGGAAPSPPVLASMNYTVIDTAGGGQRIVFAVDSSAGCVSAEIAGGSALTSFAIDDATHVSGIAPAHAAGAVSFTVTNGAGASNALAGSKYWDPSLVTGIHTWLDSNRGVTDAGAGAVSAWLDGSNARNFVQGSGALRPTQTAAQFGSLPGIVFAPQQNVRLAAPVIIVGLSVFVVAKWTSTDSTATRGDVLPLNAVGDITNASMAFGASAGEVASLKLNSGGNPVATTSSGAALNDGAAHHVGAVTTTTTCKLYSGGSQLGATDSTGGGIYATTTFDGIGNSYTQSDGWAGNQAEVVVVTGVITAPDYADLYQHARQRWGVT
jgi:hypothetical protein